jgi:DNA-binding NtrC family response regulator
MKRNRVLIVEDNLVQIKIFEKIVNKIDIKCHLASNGEDAIQAVKEYDDIGLVLLDLMLPDIAGFDVLKQIKLINKDLPVAILSASEDSKIALRAGKLGAEDFFVKGNSSDDLIRLCEFISDTLK